MVRSRLEVSFYGDKLKKVDLYEYIIKLLYPKSSINLIDYKYFREVKIEEYWKILHTGEK